MDEVETYVAKRHRDYKRGEDQGTMHRLAPLIQTSDKEKMENCPHVLGVVAPHETSRQHSLRVSVPGYNVIAHLAQNYDGTF